MNTEEKPPLIIIVGPTAVGKTEIAVQLAEKLRGEVISADSRMFYRGMDIGTAKPSLKERRGVPHHLIDIADPDEVISLADFQQKAGAAIAGVLDRSRLPFLVGGTGQYIRSVTESWQPPSVVANEKLRQALNRLKEEKGQAWIFDKLSILDPSAAEKIDPRNVRRVIRALEVILATGQLFSNQRRRGRSGYRYLTIGLMRPRADLYARVDERIDAMFERGLIQEAADLVKRGYSPELPSMSAIGYPECMKVLKGEWDIEAAKKEMKRLTRIFIRRQANWFKEGDPTIQWFAAGDPHVPIEIEHVVRSWFAMA